jgi:AraC-like DNA-binding protein
MSAARARLVREKYGASEFVLARREPPPALRPYLAGATGYSERTEGPTSRREMAGSKIVVILESGPPLRVYDEGDRHAAVHHAGFVAGLGNAPTLTEHDGSQSGVQLDFTALGARLFFDMPMSEVAHRVVDLNDALDPEARRELARIAEIEDWDDRLDRVDRWVMQRIARARSNPDVGAWAYDRIVESGGLVDIGALADEACYSQKHLIALFRDFAGVPPKLFARLTRFDRVVTHIRTGGTGNWAAIAARFGYADHAHLARDFRELAGMTPTEARKTLVSY